MVLDLRSRFSEMWRVSVSINEAFAGYRCDNRKWLVGYKKKASSMSR